MSDLFRISECWALLAESSLKQQNFRYIPPAFYCAFKQMKNPITKPYSKYVRAIIEMGFIIFLFYSNLLMGEYDKTGNAQTKGFIWAVGDIFTAGNFLIAAIAALIGYVVFEFLRKKI
jgi:hypothetical protein